MERHQQGEGPDLPGVGGTSTGGFIRYRLILSNALYLSIKKSPFPFL